MHGSRTRPNLLSFKHGMVFRNVYAHLLEGHRGVLRHSSRTFICELIGMQSETILRLEDAQLLLRRVCFGLSWINTAVALLELVWVVSTLFGFNDW